jgi:hypothetical protein
VAVWHCGIVPQSGIESWHGQSATLSVVIAVVIMHALAIAVLATGANAVVSVSRSVSRVRDHVMESSFRATRHVALASRVFKLQMIAEYGP